MTTQAAPTVAAVDQPQRSDAIVPQRPARAPDVELIGEMSGTGFQDQPWLIARDGHFCQVPELLFRILEHADGERTLEEIAAGVTEATEWIVSADQVRQIVQTRLVPRGLVAAADGSVTSPHKGQGRSTLQVSLRTPLLGPRLLNPLTQVLQALYMPAVLIPLLLLIVLAHVWLYAVQGLEASIRAVVFVPGGLLAAMALVIAAGLFHELGHAAALRYGGGRARGIGGGFYLFFPVFYTESTENYRLGRWARVRTDLGGFYFHLIFALCMVGLYLVSGQELLLVLVPLINLAILRELIPFIRLDGYWVLADLTGIPDPFSQMVPFLKSLLPASTVRGAKLPPLRPWVRFAYIAYSLLAIPALALLFFLIVKGAPEVVATTWDAVLYQIGDFGSGWRTGNHLLTATSGAQIVVLALPVLGLLYLLGKMGGQYLRAIWIWSKPTSARRVTGVLLTTGTLGLVVSLWAPQLGFLGASAPLGVERFDVTDSSHVSTPVTYAQTPPVGGSHAPIWHNCGFYDTPISSETAVHSLEHGAVWITYRPDLDDAQLSALRQVAARGDHVLASPFPDLPAPVVASAWGRQLRLETADDPRLGDFVRAFQQGAQAPERGGPCAGGVGVPAGA